MKKIKNFILLHKVASILSLIAIVGIAGIAVFASTKKTDELKYVTARAAKATIISSITGSGQVAASNEVTLSAKASGTITYVGVKAGAAVHKGQTLFAIDSRDAERAVRNAQTDLETAQLELEKFQKGPDDVDVLEIQSAIHDTEISKEDAALAVQKAYRNLLNSSTAPSSLSSDSTSIANSAPIISGTYQKDTEATITLRINQAGDGSYFSASSIPAGVVSGAGAASSTTPQPIGDSGLYVKFATNSPVPSTWTISLPNTTASNYASNKTAYEDALRNQARTIAAADLSAAKSKQSLNDLYQPDPLELRAKQLAVRQKQDALQDAKDALSDHYIVAPFDGLISKVDAKVGDSAGSSLGTIITDQKIAVITLNEVDLAKVKLGQKVTLTFDAVEDLTLTGEVAQLDAVGTVSQGVVSYETKIAFDADDVRIKPGMTVSAAIITEFKQDVLTVPVSAVKTDASGSYVEIFNPALDDAVSSMSAGVASVNPPIRTIVETGIADDTNIEIISGLAENDQVVSRTITAAKKSTATSSAPSLLGAGTGTRAAGNANFQTRSFQAR